MRCEFLGIVTVFSKLLAVSSVTNDINKVDYEDGCALSVTRNLISTALVSYLVLLNSRDICRGIATERHVCLLFSQSL